jgi:hypothetical protein
LKHSFEHSVKLTVSKKAGVLLDEHFEEEDTIEVFGIDGHSVVLSKKAIMNHPGTMLAEILNNDHRVTSIDLQLDRVQLDLFASFVKSGCLDFVSFYGGCLRKAVD